MNSHQRFDRCLLCESNQINPLKGYQKDHLVKCGNCGFVFCGQKPTEYELTTHYDGYPRNNSISPITIKRYQELLKQFEPYRKTNNIIDVGCGDGFFLEVAKRNGWNVFGTEFTTEAVKVCEDKGIQMSKGPLNPGNYPINFFDIITSFEVIEHINNPREEITHFYNLLRDGGIAYVTTPNFNSISRTILKWDWNVIEYPEHLSYYTPRTLAFLFKQANFKKRKTSTTGISIDRLRAGANKPEASARVDTDEKLRRSVEGNVLLRLAKSIINSVLNLSGKGDAMKATFQKTTK